MKYRKSFLNEVKRFERCCDHPPTLQNESGLRQFYDFESRGIRPVNPDPYFTRLWNGKAWWEWTVNEYAKLYGTFEWQGWFQLGEDFGDDISGVNQIAKRIGVVPSC